MKNILTKEVLSEIDQNEFYEIHIDEVFNVKRSKREWLKQSLELYKAILIDIETKGFNSLFVYISIDLKGELYNKSLNILHINDLKPDLSYTPPSLYIIKKDSKNEPANFNKIKKHFLINQQDFQCYYLVNYHKEDNLHYKTIYLWRVRAQLRSDNSDL